METVGRREKRRRWGLFHADPIVLDFLGESTHGHFVLLGHCASFQFQGIDLEVGAGSHGLLRTAEFSTSSEIVFPIAATAMDVKVSG